MLLPQYFGLMTLVGTLISGVGLMSDIGLAPNVIRSPRGDDPVFLNTAWTIQVVRGIALFILALALSWPIAHLYREQQLLLLLPTVAVTLLISGFNSMSLLSLSRHMGVRRLFAIDFSTQCVAFAVTLAWAVAYPSVWALVGGSVVSCLYRLGLSHMHAVAPGTRNKFHWDAESARSMVEFGKWILLGTSLYFFASQADRLILGRLVSFTVLGVYGVAFALSDIPRQIINAFCNKVGYPFIAKLAHLPIQDFRSMFLHYRFYVLLVGAGVLSITVNWGGFAVTKMYDSRYHEASWMVPILALGLWHTLMYATAGPALFSLGKSHYLAAGNAFYCAVVLLGIPLGFHFFGMLGAVIAVALGDLPLYVATGYGASREGVGTWRQDFKTTCIFAGLLAAEFLCRRAMT